MAVKVEDEVERLVGNILFSFGILGFTRFKL